MKIHSTETQEICIENDDMIVAAYPWGNHEGLTLMIDFKKGSTSVLAMRWEEFDVLQAAICAARSA